MTTVTLCFIFIGKVFIQPNCHTRQCRDFTAKTLSKKTISLFDLGLVAKLINNLILKATVKTLSPYSVEILLGIEANRTLVPKVPTSVTNNIQSQAGNATQH